MGVLGGGNVFSQGLFGLFIFCPSLLVHKDRTDNADAAHGLRLSKLPDSAANGEAVPARDDSPLPDNFYE